MPLKPSTSLTDLIGRRYDAGGLQFAHIIGVNFYGTPGLAWLRPLLSVSEDVNFAVLPESERGSVILGVAAHLGQQNGAFDRFFFNGPSAPAKFLEEIHAQIEADLAIGADEQEIRNTYRDQVLNLLDYVKVLFLYDEVQRAAGYARGSEPQSFALNVSDPRFSTRRDVAGYYGEIPGYNGTVIRKDLLDYESIVGRTEGEGNFLSEPNPIYKKIADARAAGVSIDANWLVTEFPELSRLLYPGGEIAWATREGAAYRTIQADVLAREAVLSGVVRLDSTANGRVERLDSYDDFEVIRSSPTFALVVDDLAFALDELSEESRKAAITGNILLEKLTWEDQKLFAGIFDSLFYYLNSSDVDAYRRATAPLAEALTASGEYLESFNIDPTGDAYRFGVADDVADRMGIGAAVKTHALTKTIVAEGRYGEASAEYVDWWISELVRGGSLAQRLSETVTAIIATTPTAGYYRVENTGGATFAELAEQALELTGHAPHDGGVARLGEAVDELVKGLDPLLAHARKAVETSRAVLPDEWTAFLDKTVRTDIEFVTGDGATFARGADDILLGFDGAILQGGDDRNLFAHFGHGEALGGKGNDILLGVVPDRVQNDPGETHEPGAETNPNGYGGYGGGSSGGGGASGSFGGFAGGGGSFGGGGAGGSWEPLPEVAAAQASDTLLLDGGEGDDWVISIGGQGAVTAGGLGRDWIFNTSGDGILWGDYASGVDEFGVKAEDISANADNFWFFPDTTIMDAQHYDVLKFFGIPLTGGDAAASMVAFALGASTGSMFVTSGVVAAANQAAADSGNSVYFDHLLPFITYKRDGNDLLVGNVFDHFFEAVTGREGIFNVPDGGGGSLDLFGVQRIKNFDFESGMWGFQNGWSTIEGLAGKPPGTMNMVFKDGNPYLDELDLIAKLPSIAGSGLFAIRLQAMLLLDALLVTMSALVRSAKANLWAFGADPLVIDLDGDGIETVAMDMGQVWFDGDANAFAERTGWLRGDDGFLVLDGNGNGRIDDGSELFGGRFEGGLAELAAFDLNGDGLIDAADAVFAELQVWRDLDQDGASDAGELVSLEALGIVSLSLAGTALGTTTPQGTELLTRADVTFAGGSVRRKFEAVNDNSISDLEAA